MGKANEKGRTRKGCLMALAFGILIVIATCGYYLWALQPADNTGKSVRYKVGKASSVDAILRNLEAKKLIRSANMATIRVRFSNSPRTIKAGTYSLSSAQDINQILNALQNPLRFKFRFPETNWALRNSKLLERDSILPAASYLAEFRDPAAFRTKFKFLPDGIPNLEGFLYPDTYEFDADSKANVIIEKQLATFQRKVVNNLPPNIDLYRTLTIASMVELEVKLDEERAIVAGVIENRLRKGMPLQIDATINYALQKWRPLLVSEYRSVKSPFNTYLTRSLPPTPICSPSWRSIKAAAAPASHNYFYYVAMPEGNHLFSSTYDQHLANIKKRRAAIRQQAASTP